MNKHIVELAKNRAEESTFRFRLGAVIFNKKTILGMGYNKPYKTHPKSNTPYKTIHAEFDAAVGLWSSEPLEGASIYVHRLGRDGKVRLARPCKHCIAMLKGYGLKRMFYSTEEGYNEEAL